MVRMIRSGGGAPAVDRPRCEQRLVQVGRPWPRRADVLGEGAGGVDDVGLAAVVEGDLQVEAVVVGGARLGLAR